MIKAAVLAILVVVLAWQAASCHHRIEEKRLAAQRHDEAFAARVAYEPSPLPLDPFKRRAAIADSMRLRPDRRFLLATREIALLTGGSAPEAAARFDGSRWILTVGDASLGEVPELPGFSDLLRPLVALAAQRLATAPLSEGDTPAANADPMWEPDARAVLPAQLSRWAKGERTPAVLHESARAAAALAFYQIDHLGIADSLAARAIALVALDIAAAKAPVAGEQTVLASALGYGRAARDLSATLPAGDSLRRYLAGDDAGLRERATLREGTPVDRYLRVRRAMDRDDSADANEFLESFHGTERLELAVLGQLLRQREMERYTSVAFGLPLFVLAAAENHPVPQVPGGDESDALRSALPALAADLHAPPGGDSARLEAALAKGDAGVAQYLRGLWISALRQQGEYFRISQANRESSEQFAQYLARDASPAVKKFHQWYAAATSLMTGRAASAFAAIEQLDGVGGEATARLLDEATDQADYSDPKALRAARKAIARLDSRVSHRMALAGVAWSVLQDVPSSQRLYQSGFEAGPEDHVRTRAWIAALSGDTEDVLRIGTDKLLPRSIRLYALERLEKKDADAARRALHALVDEDPKDYDATWILARGYRNEKRYDEARAVLERYLRVADGPGVHPANVRGALSRYAFLQGRYQEGLDIVEPALPVYNAEALRHAALNLAGLGRSKEAREWADALVERYSGGSEIAVTAEVEWLLGDFDAAASRIARSTTKLGWEDYRRALGERFVRRFGKNPKEAVAATAAMAKAGLRTWDIDELAVALDEAKLYETAFAVHSSLRHPEPPAQDILRLRAGRSLREVRGAEEARAWFAKVMGPIDDARGRNLALSAFRDHQPEEVWELVPDPKQAGGQGETTWMLRAAALALRGDAQSAEWRQALKRHYATAPDSPHVRIGRYLAGLATDTETAGIVNNLPASCEVPYYFGVRAQGEKRTRDALDWYRVALECGDRSEAEYVFAQNELYLFRGGDTPFAFLR